MYLFLNTSSAERIDFLFATAKKILLSKHLLQPKGKRVDVLYELSKALKKLKKTPQNIRGIAVVVGPGYFSHLRTGIAIANTFTFVQNTRLLHAKQLLMNLSSYENASLIRKERLTVM